MLGNPNLVNASFLLSEFYDGGKVFRRKARSVWPLVVTLLNLSPADRHACGIGMFMAAIHDLKVGCEAEQSIFTQLFIPELQMLLRGIVFDVLDDAGNKQQVYLQARLIVHSLDTPALQKTARIHGIYLN